MPTYRLEHEFASPADELALLRALLDDPALDGRYRPRLDAALFTLHRAEFALVRQFLDAPGQIPRPTLSGKALPEAFDSEETLANLERLMRLRAVARWQEQVSEALFSPSADPLQLVSMMETGLQTLRSAVRREPSAIASASVLSERVLLDATARFEERKRSGKSVHGIPTGLDRLDQLLNGLTPGLHVLAAGPGMGKTTLCLQWTLHAAQQGFPVIYVSFENSAANLTLKLICSQSQQSPTRVERGFADMTTLEAAAQALAPSLPRITFIEGTRRLRLTEVERVAVEAVEQAGRGPALIVFDYLQRAAHGLGYEQLRHNVSALAAEMRELSTRLSMPIVAISSQNRAMGDYSRAGRPALDSLKESGDLEYGADTVMILHSRDSAAAAHEVRPLELSILKNRFGPLGAVPLIFRADYGVFREEGGKG